MKLDDLYPFVLPWVPQMPIPTVDHHLRIAANEFFNRTLAWRADLDSFLSVDAKTDYDLDEPIGSEITKVVEVDCDGRDYAKACQLLQVDGPVLRFLETPPAAKTVVVSAALSPKIGQQSASWAIPDGLSQYRKDIALGALSSLKSLSGDAMESDRYMGKFNARIASVAAFVNLSRTRARMGQGSGRSAAQFF